MAEGFSDEEIGKMIKAFSYSTYTQARSKAIIALLADTGIRSGELRA